MKEFASRIASVRREPIEPVTPELPGQMPETFEHDFLMHEMERKLAFAGELSDQYIEERNELINSSEVPGEEWPDKKEKEEWYEDRITEMRELIKLGMLAQQNPGTREAADAAKKIATYAFPFETQDYSDKDLIVKLKVKQNRLEYLTETAKPLSRAKTAYSAGKDELFSLRAGINDLKNQINQIQGEIALRGLSASGRPDLHIVEERAIDDEEGITLKAEQLEPKKEIVWDTSDMGDSETQLIRREALAPEATASPAILKDTVKLKKPEQKIAAVKQEIADIDYPPKRDLINEEIEQLLDSSTLDEDARVTILASREFVDNLIAAGYTPKGGEDNRQILADEVVHQLNIFDAKLKKNFPDIIYDADDAEPIVGLWGSLTNKVGKIKKTAEYAQFKTFFDFSKDIPGLKLSIKQPTKSPGVVKRAFVASSGVLGAAGIAYAASQSGGTIEPGMKPAVKIADNSENSKTPKINKRAPEAEVSTESVPEQIEETAPTYNGQAAEEMPSSAPRREPEKTPEVEPAPAIPVVKKTQPRVVHKSRPTIHQVRLTPLDNLVDPRKDKMGKIETPIDKTAAKAETTRLAHEDDVDADDEEADTENQVTAKYRETLAKDGREALLAAQPIKEKLEGLRPLLGSIMNDKKDVDLWIGKLGIALEDALRFTPAEKRSDVVKKLEGEIAKAQTGSGLEIKRANAMGKGFGIIFRANSSSDEAPDILKGFEQTLLK